MYVYQVVFFLKGPWHCKEAAVWREVCFIAGSSEQKHAVASVVQNEVSPPLFSRSLSSWSPLGPRFSSAAAAQHTSLPLAPSPWSASQSLTLFLLSQKVEKNSTAVVHASSLTTDSSTNKAFFSLSWCKSVRGQLALSQLSVCSINTRTWVHLPAAIWKTDGDTCLQHQCYGNRNRRIPGAHWSDRSTESAMADSVSKNKVEKW